MTIRDRTRLTACCNLYETLTATLGLPERAVLYVPCKDKRFKNAVIFYLQGISGLTPVCSGRQKIKNISKFFTIFCIWSKF